jgi:hypothetical protein
MTFHSSWKVHLDSWWTVEQCVNKFTIFIQYSQLNYSKLIQYILIYHSIFTIFYSIFTVFVQYFYNIFTVFVQYYNISQNELHFTQQIGWENGRKGIELGRFQLLLNW